MSSRFTVSHINRFVRRQKLVLAAVIMVASVSVVSLYSKPTSESKAGDAKTESVRAGPKLDKFVTHNAPKPMAAKLAEMALIKPDGGETNLAALTGGQEPFVLVNFWATWCAPCRKEMPQLDALAARYKDKGVKVVTLSVDRAGAEKGEKFLNQLGIAHVTRLYDPSYKSARAAALIGLPTTLLLNDKGAEIGRLAGEADWDAPEVHALLDYYLQK